MTDHLDTKFVVLMTGRSGSAWVTSTLNSIPHVTAHEALLRPKKRAPERRWDSDFACPRFVETRSKGLNLRPFSVFSYLNELYATPGAVGFKLNYAHIALYPEILVYLIKHRVRVVHLIRRNHLDVLISYAIKAKLGRAHLLKGQSAPQNIRVELQADKLIRQLKWMSRRRDLARKLLRWCGLPHIEVAYEDLLRGQADFGQIMKFLSINANGHTPQSAVVKIRSGRQRDVLSNYDEVREVLAGSKFAGLLE